MSPVSIIGSRRRAARSRRSPARPRDRPRRRASRGHRRLGRRISRAAQLRLLPRLRRLGVREARRRTARPIARAAATSYVTLSIASLGLMDAIAYRAARDGRPARHHTDHAERGALRRHVVPRVFFLLSVGALALSAGRRVLGWSAIAIAVIQLVTTAVLARQPRSDGVTLWLVWIVAASVTLARRRVSRVGAVAVARS